jgi:hypothetical protein
MSRFDIALGKKKPVSRTPAPKIDSSGSMKTEYGPRSVNFSISGPSGFRIIVPLQNCHFTMEHETLTIADYGSFNLQLTGRVANQMAEDIESAQIQPRPAQTISRPQRRRLLVG